MPTTSTIESERDLLGTAANLDVRTARGGTVLLLSQSCRFVLLFGLQIVLARLLRPEDFGLVALVTSIIAVFHLFNDLGLPMATIQRHEINHEQVSLLFWINTVWGGLLALVTAASAQLFASVFGEPRLASIILVLSAGFFFIGLGSQHRALLRRQMLFTRLAVVELFSLLAGATVAVALARLGFHYWALVYMRLATLAFVTLGLILACGWRPSRPRFATQMRPLLTFGTHLTSFDVMAFVTRNADNLLIGWFSGPRSLGFYYKAYQMLLVPTLQFTTPLGGVMIPALSRLQTQPRRYGAYYHRGLLLSAAAGMPLVAFLFVGADWVVPLLLGTQWAESVPIFRALALAAFVGPIDVGGGWLFISLGRTGRQFRWTVMSTALTLVGFFVGIHWGAIGVALSFSLCRGVLVIPRLIYTSHGSPVRWVEIIQTASRPAVASLLSAAGLFLLNRQFAFAVHGLKGLAASCLVFGLMYIGLWLILPGGRRTLKSMLGLIRYLR
jgi:O-antigen/teichoic acid export membrane protein